MQRRNFFKGMICLGCAGGAAWIFNSRKDKNILNYDKFIYKSKKDLPKEIRLEACSLCQLNCPECNVRKFEKHASKNWLGYLKFDDFKKFVDDNDFEAIELSNNGEIFLNPELDEIIKYAHYKNIRLRAFNGVNLNTVSNETLENLVKYKFSLLKISIDAATPETYKIYRRGGDFNTVINNIKKINYYKEKYNSEFPKLIYQFILFGHNEHEIELAKKKAKELGMDIRFKRNWTPEYSPIKNKALVEKQTGLKTVNNENELIKDAFDKQELFACHNVFYTPQIDYNGDLLGCCRISTRNFKANVFKQGLLEALNSANYVYAKHLLTDLSVPMKDDLPCSDCYKYTALKVNKKPLII